MNPSAEADVIVVGLGGAGAAAAITAHDAGAEVLVVERAQSGGGNTRESAGSLRHLADPERAVEHFEALTFRTTPRAVLRAFVDELPATADWLSGLGATLSLVEGTWSVGYPPTLENPYPGLATSSAASKRFRVESPLAPPGGEAVWAVLERALEAREVRVAYGTRARALRMGEGRVDGVCVEGPAGEGVVHARRAVILSCGGFASDVGRVQDLVGMQLPVLGPPGRNEGDGVRMALAVGADLWHMNALAMVVGYQLPGVERALQHQFQDTAFLYLDRDGTRFVDETGFDFHALPFEILRLEQRSARYRSVPAYAIFGESVRRAGPIVNMALRGARELGWSDDNQREVERGWITRAESLERLAVELRLDPASVSASVAAYNAACAARSDARFGRAPELMKPVEGPPYYGIPIWPVLVNTQGGPRRNERAEVLSAFGSAIPGLYAAGELGSMWTSLYPGAGNVSEALVFGRIAGREAARRGEQGSDGSTVEHSITERQDA